MDVPEEMVRGLDYAAARMAVKRQAVIKAWLTEQCIFIWRLKSLWKHMLFSLLIDTGEESCCYIIIKQNFST